MSTVQASNNHNNTTQQQHISIQDHASFSIGANSSSIQGKPHRYFFSGVNSLLGHALFEELRDDHIQIYNQDYQAHKFFGTLNQAEADTVPSPSSSIKILNPRTKPRTFKKQVISCDTFVLDLMSGYNDVEEAEFVIKSLKESQQSATLILVSSVMTWLNTPKKLKKNYPQAKPDDSDVEVVEKKRDDESDKEDVKAQTEILYFTDKDYQMRVPPPRFQQVKNLELLAMSAQKSNKNLKVYVVSSGLLYGIGESNEVFYEFFRRAWLSLHQELASLPVVGDGMNRIPTIHALDLARCIKYLITTSKPLNQSYFLAVDQAKRQTQLKIMKAISRGLGSGLYKHMELSEVIDEDWSEFLTLDLKFRTSPVFMTAFNWHCPLGLNKKTMPLLNQEFNLYRGLFPLKVFITGPPLSGKTNYANQLAQAYGIPHLKIQDLVNMGYKLQDAFGDEIRKKAEEIKDQVVADYDKTKKKKDPELDRSTIKVRLPDDILYRLIKLQMNTAACRNKGFILDGYPRNFNDAKHIFLKPSEKSQHQEESKDGEELAQDPFPGFEADSELMPQYTIVLQGEDPQLKQRMKDLPPEKTQHDPQRFTDPTLDRRLKLYREQNHHDSGNSVQCFFKNFTETKVLNTFTLDEARVMHKLQKFLERKGKPCCLNLITPQDIRFLKQLEKKYQETEQVEEDEDEVTRILKREELESRKREEEEKERQAQLKIEQQRQKEKEEQDKFKLEQIRQQERDLLDTRSQPIRQYLMDNVVPYLTMGLIDLCKKVPEEPGEYLADFLLKKADEIDQKRIQEREAAIKAKLEAKAAKQQQH